MHRPLCPIRQKLEKTAKMNVNTEYELLTKEIYETLLNEEGVTIDVKHNVKIKGKASTHQIDVYWEYKMAGIVHKVAIECKNYNKNLPIGKVRDFYGVLSDIGNINGIIVSKVGFQKGAKAFAQLYGINLKELREPTNDDWKGRVKSIQIDLNMIMTEVTERKFELDEVWIKKNINLPKNEKLPFHIGGMTNEIWIVKENKEKIKNFYQLENELPQNWKSETNLSHIYEYDNGYIEVEKFGLIKVKSIEFIYDVHVGNEKPIIIDGTSSAKAILKDAITGEIKFFNKDGKVK